MRRSLLLIAGLCVSQSVLAQGEPEIIAKIIEEGKGRNKTRSHLEHLCEQIGSRLTGSTTLDIACDWTTAQFASWGLDARKEKWGEIPVGFDRAPFGHSGRMVFPTHREFQFTTRSWTPGTNGLQRGPAVMEPKSVEEANAMKDQLKGAWVVMLPRQGEGLPSNEVRAAVLEVLSGSGILGTVSGARNELVVTSGSWSVDMANLPKYCAVTVRASDYQEITKSIGHGGAPVQLEFNLIQSFRKGPLPIYNVVADIKGTEKPDEVVIVSGHLDSWDGPGNQGACDNGTGCSVVLEAARILSTVGAKPKRTIRFILWTGEEQGLHGSRTYVNMHEADLGKISAVLVDDGGTNYWGGLVGIASQQTMLEAAIQPLHEAFPELPIKVVIRDRMPRGGGSDHAPFNAKGVPGFFSEETGVADYNYIHHTQHDKLTAAINTYLIQSSTAAAVTAYNLACADGMLPREQAGG